MYTIWPPSHGNRTHALAQSTTAPCRASQFIPRITSYQPSSNSNRSPGRFTPSRITGTPSYRPLVIILSSPAVSIPATLTLKLPLKVHSCVSRGLTKLWVAPVSKRVNAATPPTATDPTRY
ncbi:hypothetical protein Bca52824_001523 [Brassica carinata]|uniref:Uncharacterized protein n=1 Tax=Brassica carinata TaxID=52824 RepID=A0A8X7WLN9_BRACI|nr:hypothetical protein Bca52824_001523 [Brassica carinata]